MGGNIESAISAGVIAGFMAAPGFHSAALASEGAVAAQVDYVKLAALDSNWDFKVRDLMGSATASDVSPPRVIEHIEVVAPRMGAAERAAIAAEGAAFIALFGRELVAAAVGGRGMGGHMGVSRAVAERQAFWTRNEFNGIRTYQRNDLINPSKVGPDGRTNLQRMEAGNAPLGPDGKPMNLHHMIQSADSPLAELTQSFHQKYSRTIHINPPTVPSGIDRVAFDTFRTQYWKQRALDFRGN
jgi:filamentous hemagglutinin